jgi:hypothetical protein
MMGVSVKMNSRSSKNKRLEKPTEETCHDLAKIPTEETLQMIAATTLYHSEANMIH